jgi:mevalonate kinase
VVYGHPALVAAVDLRLTTTLRRTGGGAGMAGNGIEIRVPQLGWDRLTTTWPEIHRYTRRVRRRWQEYAAHPDPRTFDEVRGTDPAHLLKVALGEAAQDLGAAGQDPGGLFLEVRSDIPVGSGFGSSAALAATVIAGLQALVTGEPPAAKELEALVLEAERRQHGMPSGVDGATVVHGGLLWAERPADDAPLTFTPLAPPHADSPHLARFRIFDTGTPRQSTGAVVAAVRRRLEADRVTLEPVLEAMGAAARAFREELATPAADPEALRGILDRFETGLETLGVVPEPVRRVVAAVRRAGGAAKVSGAGALSADADLADPDHGAGSLLAYHPDPEALRAVPGLAALPCPVRRLGAPGLRLDADTHPRG